MGIAIKQNGSADRTRIAAKLLPPQAVTENDHTLLARLVFGRIERATEGGTRVKHFEEPRADPCAVQPPWLADARQGAISVESTCQVGEDSALLFLQTHEVRRREGVVIRVALLSDRMEH